MPAFYVSRAGLNAAITTNGQTGVMAPGARGWNVVTGVPVANRAYLQRFCPSRNMSITKIGFVTTAAANNNDAIDVGIYSSDLTTKLVSSGATSGVANATAGTQAITVTTTALTAGTVYYVAFAYGTIGGTGATLVQSDFNSTSNAAGLFGQAVGIGETFIKASSHPLPSSISSPTLNTSGVLLAVRES